MNLKEELSEYKLVHIGQAIKNAYQQGYIDGVYSEDAEMLNGETGISEEEINKEATDRAITYDSKIRGLTI